MFFPFKTCAPAKRFSHLNQPAMAAEGIFALPQTKNTWATKKHLLLSIEFLVVQKNGSFNWFIKKTPDVKLGRDFIPNTNCCLTKTNRLGPLGFVFQLHHPSLGHPSDKEIGGITLMQAEGLERKIRVGLHFFLGGKKRRSFWWEKKVEFVYIYVIYIGLGMTYIIYIY